MSDRYFLRGVVGTWHEVDMAEWVRAERAAGFHNTMGRDDLPGTGGFGDGLVTGRTVSTEHSTPEQYDWDAEFRDFVWPPITTLMSSEER